MKPLKLGMIGLGRAGYSMHLRELSGMEHMFQIVAACDCVPADYVFEPIEASPFTPAGAVFGPGIPVPFEKQELPWNDGPLDQTWVYLYDTIVNGAPYPIRSEEALKVMEAITEINRFTENEDMLPIDQHMLLACIAPRPLYVESNSQDEWADPASERRGAILASEVYELYGQKGVVIPDEPEIGTSYHEGMIGYHVSEGTHKIRRHDWLKFIEFWEKKQAE